MSFVDPETGQRITATCFVLANHIMREETGVFTFERKMGDNKKIYRDYYKGTLSYCERHQCKYEDHSNLVKVKREVYNLAGLLLKEEIYADEGREGQDTGDVPGEDSVDHVGPEAPGGRVVSGESIYDQEHRRDRESGGVDQ